MPEANEGGSKEFTSFLKGCQTVEDATSGKSTTLKGQVYRSGDSFALATTDGQMLELPPAAVERFKVVGSGLSPEVEITISADAVKTAKPLPFKWPVLDHKSVFKDIRTDPIVDQTYFYADHTNFMKDIHKDPLSDPVNKGFDPIQGTLVEQTGFDPGQQVSPTGGLMPFVMATPHHAPAHMVNLQGAAGQTPLAGAGALKQVHTETLIKEAAADFPKNILQDLTVKEMIADHHTIKEVIVDTHKELVFDTRKELIETQVEGGGTAVEGTGIPGGFPGMPHF